MLKSKIFYLLSAVFIFSNINSCCVTGDDFATVTVVDSPSASNNNSKHSSMFPSHPGCNFYDGYVPANSTANSQNSSAPVTNNNQEERISLLEKLARKVLKFVHFSS